MAIPRYLAMSAGEMAKFSPIPHPTAWMACHFSSAGLGLSNLPASLPPECALMVDDAYLPSRLDHERILEQLEKTVRRWNCPAVVLDFQRPKEASLARLVQFLEQRLPCPTVVSHIYAGNGSFPVLLPPIPVTQDPICYIAPWKGREIWLEIEPGAKKYILRKDGCRNYEAPPLEGKTLHHDALCCSYQIRLEEDHAAFTLERTAGDTERMLGKLEDRGLGATIACWWEWQ